MKLLILLNNYSGERSTNSDTNFNKVCETFLSYTNLEVFIVAFCTKPLSQTNTRIQEILLSNELGHEFSFIPRVWLKENIEEIEDDTWIMYTENDLVIPEQSVLNAIHHTQVLQKENKNFISGFVRFEMKGEKRGKEYIDMLPCVTPTVVGSSTINDTFYWTPGNIHSGNFLLSKELVQDLIKTNRFQTRHMEFGKNYYGVLESAASDVYLEFTKFIPENFESVEIEHLSNKYYGINFNKLRHEVRAQNKHLIICPGADTLTDAIINDINSTV